MVLCSLLRVEQPYSPALKFMLQIDACESYVQIFDGSRGTELFGAGELGRLAESGKLVDATAAPRLEKTGSADVLAPIANQAGRAATGTRRTSL